MAAGTLAQFVLGALAPFLRADLTLSRAALGSLSTVFFVVGAVGSPFAGRLVDRLGGRTTLLATFGLAGAGLAGMAASPGYAALVTAMVVGGLATALVNPVTNQVVAAHLPRGAQGVITGVKQSGVQVGAFVAGAGLPALAVVAGWRSATLATALVAVGGIVATVLVVPAQHRRQAGRGNRPPRTRTGGAPPGFVGWLSAYALLMGAGVAAVGAFLVLYGVEALGLSETVAGFAAACVGGVGIVARVLWGRAAERMRTATVPLGVLAVVSIVGQVAIWAAPTVGVWLLWPGVVVFGLSAAAWNAVGMLAIVRAAHPTATGQVSGVVQAAFYVGMLICPPLFGAAVDATGSYDLGWAGVTVAFAGAAGVALAWHRASHMRPSAPTIGG